MSTTKPTSILIAGLPYDWVKKNRPGMFPEPGQLDTFFVDLQAALDDVAQTPGLYSQAYYLQPDEESNVETLQQVIRKGPPSGGKWDGILFGFGLRGDRGLSWLFESLVNFAKDNAPAAKLLFSGTLEEMKVAVHRNFPHLQQAKN